MAFNTNRVEHCPVIDANGATVYIAAELQEQLLVALYGWNQEFGALLTGTRNGRTVHVTGIEIPEQYNDRTSWEMVNNLDADWDQYIGFLHSHVAMGAFHSCDDEQGVDNAPVSLVISRTKGGLSDTDPIEWAGKVATVLPCGSAGILRVGSVVWGEPPAVVEPVWAIPQAGVSLQDAIHTDCPHWPVQPCGVVGLARDFTLYNAVVNRTKQWMQQRKLVSLGGSQPLAPDTPLDAVPLDYIQCDKCDYFVDVADTQARGDGGVVCEVCAGTERPRCTMCSVALALPDSIAAGKCRVCRTTSAVTA